MHGIIYLWRDRKHNRYYIGCHWGTDDDGYICSSKWMKQAYKKRPEDFKRRIIKRVYSDRTEMLEEEHRYLSMIREEEIGRGKNSKYYNLSRKQFGHWSTDEKKAIELKKSISEKTKEAMQKPEIRSRYLEGMSRRVDSYNPEITAQRRSESMKKAWEIKSPFDQRYKPLAWGSEEFIEMHRANSKRMHLEMTDEKKKIRGENISKGLMGKQNRLGQKNTDEHNEKIRQSNLGKKRTKETRERISQAGMNRVVSEETKQKKSEAMKKYWANKKKETIEGS